MVDTAAILFSMAERLTTVPDKDFNMREWKCGTVGCAIGHCWDLIPGMTMRSGAPVYGYKSGIEAVVNALNLSYSDVRSLFTIKGYPVDKKVTPKDVALKIREFIKEKADEA